MPAHWAVKNTASSILQLIEALAMKQMATRSNMHEFSVLIRARSNRVLQTYRAFGAYRLPQRTGGLKPGREPFLLFAGTFTQSDKVLQHINLGRQLVFKPLHSIVHFLQVLRRFLLPSPPGLATLPSSFPPPGVP